MTGNTFKENRRDLYGPLIISVLVTETEWSMGSDFQQVASFNRLLKQNRDEAE